MKDDPKLTQPFKMEESKKKALMALPRFQGMNFSVVMRLLVSEALEDSKPAQNNVFDDIGLLGIIPDYRYHDFSNHIQESRDVFVKVPDFAFFSSFQSQGWWLERRISDAEKCTIIVIPTNGSLVAGQKAQTNIVATERIRLAAAKYNGSDPCPSRFALIFRDEAAMHGLPDFALISDREAFSSGALRYQTDGFHAFHWLSTGDVNADDFNGIRSAFLNCYDMPESGFDVKTGSYPNYFPPQV